ncbi:MAG: hypothetical protein WD061_01450 [Candidatus Saccharimonadales bacterium]
MSVIKVVGLQHPNASEPQITMGADGSVNIEGLDSVGGVHATFTDWSKYYDDNKPAIDFGTLSQNVDFSSEYFPANKIDFAIGTAQTDFGVF